MKLARVKTAGATRLVAVIDGKYLDLAAVDPQIPGCLKALLADAGGLARAQAAVLKAGANGPWVTGELATPIGSPGKVICIGLNYRDHAIESGAPIPEEPICFSKFTTAITGPGCPVPLPSVCTQIDYEAELVVVIGKSGKKIAEAEALSYVAGYMNGNDVSARDWQLHKPGKQWLAGKTFDTFAPVGPELVSADEVADPHALDLADVGGHRTDLRLEDHVLAVDAHEGPPLPHDLGDPGPVRRAHPTDHRHHHGRQRQCRQRHLAVEIGRR